MFSANPTSMNKGEKILGGFGVYFLKVGMKLTLSMLLLQMYLSFTQAGSQTLKIISFGLLIWMMSGIAYAIAKLENFLNI